MFKDQMIHNAHVNLKCVKHNKNMAKFKEPFNNVIEFDYQKHVVFENDFDLII